MFRDFLRGIFPFLCLLKTRQCIQSVPLGNASSLRPELRFEEASGEGPAGGGKPFLLLSRPPRSSLATLGRLSHTHSLGFLSLSDYQPVNLLVVFISPSFLLFSSRCPQCKIFLSCPQAGVEDQLLFGTRFLRVQDVLLLVFLTSLRRTVPLTGVDKTMLYKIWRARLSLLGQHLAASSKG